MAAKVEPTVVGDIVKQELGLAGSRRTLRVAASQTLVMGELCTKGGGGMKALGANANEVQAVAITGTLTAGSYRLGFPGYDGGIEWTGLIAFNAADNAAIQTAVDLIPSGSSIVVGGTLRTAQTFTYSGLNYVGQGWPLVQLDMGELTGLEDSKVSRTTAGGTGVAAIDEVQTLTVTGADTGTEDYTLLLPHYNGTTITTGVINFDDNAAAVEAVIETALLAATPVVPVDSIKVGGTDAETGDLTLTFSGEEYEGRTWPLTTVGTLPTGWTAATFARTTSGGPASGGEAEAIILEAVTTGAGAFQDAAFLVRNASVDYDYLTIDDDTNEVDAINALEALGISVLREPATTS